MTEIILRFFTVKIISRITGGYLVLLKITNANVINFTVYLGPKQTPMHLPAVPPITINNCRKDTPKQ